MTREELTKYYRAKYIEQKKEEYRSFWLLCYLSDTREDIEIAVTEELEKRSDVETVTLLLECVNLIREVQA